MTTPRFHRLILVPAVMLMSLVLGLPQLVVSADTASSEADEVVRLAERGRFDTVVARISDSPDLAGMPGAPTLLTEIETYNTALAAQDAVRRKDKDRITARMIRQADAGRLEDAVISAVEASTLSDDPDAFRRDARVAQVIRTAEVAAAEAQKNGQWLEALNLYRALDLLFDDNGQYHALTKHASQHVRVLRIYAPDHLDTLIKARIERRKLDQEADAAAEAAEAGEKVANDDPSSVKQKLERDDPETVPDNEPWEERLRGVEPAMLRQSFAQIARRHFHVRGYATPLNGALIALEVLIDTTEVGDTFPKLKDADSVAVLREAIKVSREEIARDPENLSFLDAASVLDRILAANSKSVELPEAVIVYEMTDGAIDTLDEFSSVIWPRESESFARLFQGNFSGIGVQIFSRNGRITIDTPIEGTPAHRAGLRAGDIIATVDGVETKRWSLSKAVEKITGKKGTDVDLGIERAGHEGLIPYKITRGEIKIESIKGWTRAETGGWEYYIDPALRIGYVRLLQFIPQSATDLDNAIAKMEKAGGVNGLILDLRFNPGGQLSSAVDVVNRFVPEGPIVFTVGPDETRNSELRARKSLHNAKFPVVVLVNQGSASASEIVSGALQDYGRALVVGTRSFGKFSVQDVMPIDAGKAYLKLTTQHYQLPSGRSMHREPGSKAWGVEPDLIVKMTDKQVFEAIQVRQSADVIRSPETPADPDNPIRQASELLNKSLDPQLQTALLVLKTRVVTSGAVVAQK